MKPTKIGRVQISSNSGRIVYRFCIKGKQQSLSAGLPDTLLNRLECYPVARLLSHDIKTGRYDSTRKRYKLPKDEIQRLLDRIDAKDDPHRIFPHELLELYIERRTDLSRGNAARFSGNISHCRRHFRITCDRLDNKALLAYANYLIEQGVSVSVVRDYLRQIRLCLRYSLLIDEYNLPQNLDFPAVISHLPKPPKKTKRKCLMDEEITRLFGVIADEYPQYELFFRALRDTGCRPSELRAATFADLYLGGPNPAIAINKSLTRYDERDATKTGVDRDVFIPTELAQDLSNLTGMPDDRVFPDCIGNKFEYAWRRIQVIADVHTCLYNFRHTRATKLLQAGANPQTVAEQLGHSVQTLWQHYSHVQKATSYIAV